MGSQSPRGSYLVPLYKARGGPHVCPLFAFRNQPIATPRAASELHSRDDRDFKGIARPNILRTGIQRPDQFLTASSAARGLRNEPSATASSAARGRRSEHQRSRERRSASAPSHRLLGGGVRGPPGGGVGRSGGEGRLPPGRRFAGLGGSWGEGRIPAEWRGWGVRGGGPPPRRAPVGGVSAGHALCAYLLRYGLRASPYYGLSEPERVLPSPFICSLRWFTCVSVIRVSEPANHNAARGLGTTFARWPSF